MRSLKKPYHRELTKCIKATNLQILLPWSPKRRTVHGSKSSSSMDFHFICALVLCSNRTFQISNPNACRHGSVLVHLDTADRLAGPCKILLLPLSRVLFSFCCSILQKGPVGPPGPQVSTIPCLS